MASLRLFFSVGDHSGDQHAANLMRELQKLDPDVQLEGLGGDSMAQAGCQLLYPLCDLAIMGFRRVLTNLHKFARIRNLAARHLDEHRPDAVVLIDYGGFNLRMAKLAHQRGIPVFYFIAPQMWAWRSWRVKTVQRYVDHVFSTLPFEMQWYQERNVSASFVGHPYFDELHQKQLDQAFLAQQRQLPGTVLGILPGSRFGELTRNTELLFATAERIHQQRPEARFLIPCLKEEHAQFVRERLQAWGNPKKIPLEIHVGKTSEIIELAHSCVSVSGSVSLEMLYRTTPTVICYKANVMLEILAALLKNCRFITLVNLMEDRLLFPEHYGTKVTPELLSGHVLEWMSNPQVHQQLRAELEQLKARVAKPGACRRVAQSIFSTLKGEQSQAA